MEPIEWPKGSQASCGVLREDSEKNHVVPTAWQDEALARDGVSREVPCSALKPGWGRQHHSQRETPFVPSKRLPDWASLDASRLERRAESLASPRDEA